MAGPSKRCLILALASWAAWVWITVHLHVIHDATNDSSSLHSQWGLSSKVQGRHHVSANFTDLSVPLKSTKEDPIYSSIISSLNQTKRTLHIIHCLSSNRHLDPNLTSLSGLVDEWEVSLKSVLVNAPLEADLHIHVIADEDASLAVLEKLERANLAPLNGMSTSNKGFRGSNASNASDANHADNLQNANEGSIAPSLWRNQVTITVSNIESRKKEWSDLILKLLMYKVDSRIGVGGYFRLFAHEIILGYASKNSMHPIIATRKNDDSSNRIVRGNLAGAVFDAASSGDSVDDGLRTALYMDTDVVILSNLDIFIRSMDEVLAKRNSTKSSNGGNGNAKHPPFLQYDQYPLWTWGNNSGFVTLNLPSFHNFWILFKRILLQEGPNLLKSDSIRFSDQSLLTMVQDHFPNVVGAMPDEWNVHIGHGYRKRPQLLYNVMYGDESGAGNGSNGSDGSIRLGGIHNLQLGRLNVGMLHFTGAGTGSTYFSGEGIAMKFCKRGRGCNATVGSEDLIKMEKSWGRAEYYVKMEWDGDYGVKHLGGLRNIRHGEKGHGMIINYRLV